MVGQWRAATVVLVLFAASWGSVQGASAPLFDADLPDASGVSLWLRFRVVDSDISQPYEDVVRFVDGDGNVDFVLQASGGSKRLRVTDVDATSSSGWQVLSVSPITSVHEVLISVQGESYTLHIGGVNRGTFQSHPGEAVRVIGAPGATNLDIHDALLLAGDVWQDTFVEGPAWDEDAGDGAVEHHPTSLIKDAGRGHIDLLAPQPMGIGTGPTLSRFYEPGSAIQIGFQASSAFARQDDLRGPASFAIQGISDEGEWTLQVLRELEGAHIVQLEPNHAYLGWSAGPLGRLTLFQEGDQLCAVTDRTTCVAAPASHTIVVGDPSPGHGSGQTTLYWTLGASSMQNLLAHECPASEQILPDGPGQNLVCR